MRETESFAGTQTQRLLDSLDVLYTEIEEAQEAWKQVSPFNCTDGCGSCCVDFEPDVLEIEALYLAAWLVHHDGARADAIMNGSFVSPRPDPENGCILFDPDNPYHCTVYGGRCLICRQFGYSGDRGKDGRPRWKPCKFLFSLPEGQERRSEQFEEAEMLEKFGMTPPVMSDISAQVTALMPDGIGDRLPLREALPAAISKILMLRRFSLDTR